LAEAETLSDAALAVWPVLTDTHFGRILGARLILLELGGMALGDGTNAARRALAAAATGLAIVPQSWTATCLPIMQRARCAASRLWECSALRS
jgi:hypothetical protein